MMLLAVLWPGWCGAGERAVYVSPGGDDGAGGTKAAPFRTVARAQIAARELVKRGEGDVVVNLAAGEYRIEKTIEFTAEDSGRGGRVIYRSSEGPGKARLVGSRVLKGWQAEKEGVWKIQVPEKVVFHTLYEGGKRAWKARFPDRQSEAGKPLGLGRYMLSTDGSPIQSDKNPTRPEGAGWLTYGSEEAVPETAITKMRMQIYPRGKCDWVREVHPVAAMDLAKGRITLPRCPMFGIGQGARFFLEDERVFLNAAGEFFLDETTRTLYYKPLGQGHPDGLGIAYPVVSRMIQVEGSSREKCVENVVLEGLGLEESDCAPPLPLWAYEGLRDGALIWLNNTTKIEIRNCHLKNGGRSGVMLIGHNVGNRVSGCRIEHMGLNGVSLCNRFVEKKRVGSEGKQSTGGQAASGTRRAEATPSLPSPGVPGAGSDRCEGNRVHNCWISHVGEMHTYAECVTVFNASHNEVDHCRLEHSVRYAVTVRGNTGQQYGPPVWTDFPPAKGNRFHHLSVAYCGQDGGDMGALHTAALNNPGGGCVNYFEQITVADTAAIESMRDIACDGVFLDWPKMSMDQVFRNVQIVRSQGMQFRTNGKDNAESTVTENVSWKKEFKEEGMEYEQIGLTAEFPKEFGGGAAKPAVSGKVGGVRATAAGHDRVVVEWEAVKAAGEDAGGTEYIVMRDGETVGRIRSTRWEEGGLAERKTYRYAVRAKCGDFARPGEAAECAVTTPADTAAAKVTGARVVDGKRVRVAFDEVVEAGSACAAANYRFEPELKVSAVEMAGSRAVELSVEGYDAKRGYQLGVEGVSDVSVARNRMAGASVAVGKFDVTVRYAMDEVAGVLKDSSGGGGDAKLLGGAALEKEMGPTGGVALVLDGVGAYAEGPADLNLGAGDFTLGFWVYREKSGVMISKGNDFGRPDQWSIGLGKEGVPGSVSLRINNVYFATGAHPMKERQWAHLAFVRKGNVGRWYVNGRPSGEAQDMSKVGALVNDRPLRIGRREHEPNPMWFRGRVAGVTIWPRAVSEEEMKRMVKSEE